MIATLTPLSDICCIFLATSLLATALLHSWHILTFLGYNAAEAAVRHKALETSDSKSNSATYYEGCHLIERKSLNKIDKFEWEKDIGDIVGCINIVQTEYGQRQ